MQKIRGTYKYPVYPLDEEVVMKCQKISEISGPHDRIIVITSQILNAKLVTKDNKIKKSNLIETVW